MRPGEAEPWVQRAERVLRAETEPAAVLGMHRARGVLELARGRDADALAAFQAAERLAGRLTAPHMLLRRHGHCCYTPWCASATSSAPSRPSPASANATATAGRCASPARCCGSPETTRARRWPRSRPSWTAPHRYLPAWLVEAFLLEAIARDALGDPGSADRALERALDLAEPDGALLWFLLHPVPGLLQRHARHRTAHPALVADILSLLAGRRPRRRSPGRDRRWSR